MGEAESRPTPAADPACNTFRNELVALLPHLRAFARGLCGRPDQADDLVQETVVRAWTARDNFAAGTNLKAWTFTIMRNHFLNDLRRSRRQEPLDDEMTDRLLVARATQEEGLHISDLQRALDQLPEERKEALLLVGASGFTYEEAAQVCDVPVGTMKRRVARGRQQLYQLLEESGGARPASRLR